MFYSYDILNAKGKGSLPLLWLLATDQLKHSGPNLRKILGIKLAEPCEEILQYMNNPGPNTNDRFSLYLSSTLMYGVVKLYGRQVQDLCNLAVDLCADVNRTWRLTATFDAPMIERSRVTLKESLLSDLPGAFADEEWTIEMPSLPVPRPGKKPVKNGLKRRRGELERPAPTEERLEAREDILSILEADWLNLDHINGDLSRVTIREDEMLADHHHELLADQMATINEGFGLGEGLGQSTLVDTLDELGRELAMDVEKDPKERVELEQLPETCPIISEVQKVPALDETPVRPTEPSPQLKRKRQRSGQSGDETAVAVASSVPTGSTDESQMRLEPWVGGRDSAFIIRKPGRRLKIDQKCQLGHSFMRAQFADSTSTQRVQTPRDDIIIPRTKLITEAKLFSDVTHRKYLGKIISPLIRRHYRVDKSLERYSFDDRAKKQLQMPLREREGRVSDVTGVSDITELQTSHQQEQSTSSSLSRSLLQKRMDEPSAQDTIQLLPVQEGEAEQGFEDGHLAEQIQVPEFRTPTTTSATEKKRQADVDEEIHLAPLESSKTPHQVRPRGYISDEESPVLYTPQGKHQIVAADVHRDPLLDSGKEVQTPLAAGDGERRTATMLEEGQEAETLDGIFPLQPPDVTEQSSFIPSYISPIKEASRVQVPCFAETEEHICKLMSKLRKCIFEDLLPKNPIRLEAARVFFVLLDLPDQGCRPILPYQVILGECCGEPENYFEQKEGEKRGHFIVYVQ